MHAELMAKKKQTIRYSASTISNDLLMLCLQYNISMGVLSFIVKMVRFDSLMSIYISSIIDNVKMLTYNLALAMIKN